MERENPFDPDPVGNLADGKRLAKATVLAADHNPLERLDTAFIPLHDLDVDFDSVTRFERDDILLHLLHFDKINPVHVLSSSLIYS